MIHNKIQINSHMSLIINQKLLTNFVRLTVKGAAVEKDKFQTNLRHEDRKENLSKEDRVL